MKLSKKLWLISMVVMTVILSACNMNVTAVPTQDTAAIQTEAFNLVMTQAAMAQTQTALAIPPTAAPTITPLPSPTLGQIPTAALSPLNTPIPFNTQLPGLTPLASPIPTLGSVATITTKNGCNDGTLVEESKPYDGDKLKNFTAFEKYFVILNTGTCVWDDGYKFKYLTDRSSPELKGYDIVFTTRDTPTQPGHKNKFNLQLEVPGGKTKEIEYVGYWKLQDDGGNFFGPMVWVKFIAVP
jgi:hypothetical protein